MNQRIKEYLSEITATRAEATVDNYTEHLTRFDEYLQGKAFTRQNAVGFLLALQKEGVTESSVSIHQSTLKTFFKWLFMNGYIERNVLEANAVNPYQSPARSHDFPFTLEEYERIKQEVLSTFWFGAVVTAWNTGLRLKDISYLHRDHINLTEKKISLKPSKTKRMNKSIDVPILPELYNQLSVSLEPGYLFPFMAASYTKYGNKMLSRNFGTILKVLGIQGKSWHAFRHSFISRALTADVPVPVLASITGQTLAVVERYTHITDFTKKTNALMQMI